MERHTPEQIASQEPTAGTGHGGRWARVAIAVLAVCCIFWGVSFPAMQIAAAALERSSAAALGGADGGEWLKGATSATFNGWRFSAAAAVYFLLTLRRQKGYRWGDWKGGLAVGFFLGFGMFLQLLGLKYTLPSVSGFLTALTVVLVPLGQAWVFRRPVGRETWAAVLVAMVGMVVLSQANPGATTERTLAGRPPLPLLGEILTVLGAMVFTAQILAVDRYAPNADSVKLTTLVLAMTGALNWLAGLGLGGGALHTARIVSMLAADRAFVGSSVVLVLLSSVLALHLMNIYQPRVSPATASVIYCLEPVFATGFSVMLGTESLTGITVAGGSIILAAVLIVVHASARRGSAASAGMAI